MLARALRTGDGSSPAATQASSILADAAQNQIYHPSLARRLARDGLASFRFDFRSNHESPGEWRLDDFESDIVDLKRVVAYLADLGYRIHLRASAHASTRLIAQSLVRLRTPRTSLIAE